MCEARARMDKTKGPELAVWPPGDAQGLGGLRAEPRHSKQIQLAILIIPHVPH